MRISSSNNKITKFGFFILSILLFSSCGANKDILYLNDQIIGLSSRVNKLQKTMDKKMSGEFDSKLEAIRTRQAETGAEIDKLKGQIVDLSGRVEDNRQIVKRTFERDTTDQDDMKTKLVDIAKRVGELESKVKQLSEYLHLERSGDLKRKPGASSQQPPVVLGKPLSSEDKLYNSSLATYQRERYEDAIAGFKSFLKKYPKSGLADNAQFWIGQSYMALKQYKQAILEYQEVIKKYPKGNKVPNAMLRQAMAFYEIKDKMSSKLLLKKTIKKYPNSSEAKIAKSKLKTLQ